ncbi:Gmad2 immunoglobulin-like domain-containing protein [Paenibacillus glycinis]|uniref:Bacterial spore germination immunoglobulin-like domain-containing protein n=1 Tax=Paenibacillus glycinis TaxID=2697035 RepID=A0ABW9XRM6_9BACL|nr:Gmad2 immunoglobulin-like domain-containing protein [Paenibacillus glycinis]NBD25312.1 hypothetical protein [Paenibacillus glycinis]
MTRKLAFPIGAIVLVLALTVLAGCSGKPRNVADTSGREPAVIQASGAEAATAAPDSSIAGNAGGSVDRTGPEIGGPIDKSDKGNGGPIASPPEQSDGSGATGVGSNAGAGTKAGTGDATNAEKKPDTKPVDGGAVGVGSNAGASTKAGTGDATNAEKKPDTKPKIAAANEAFRIYAPTEDSVVGKSFTVKGEARVFEAAFGYTFEDGHNVLAEGHAMADQGAPEWGNFELKIALNDLPTSPTGVLTIYESSAKDGAHVHELHIAYTFEKGILNLGAYDAA